MKGIRICSIICFFTLSFAIQGAWAADDPRVFVSILPQKYFVQQIGGDSVEVEVMVEPGASPHTYEPKPSQMKKLAASKAYFSIGVPFEHAWLQKIATINPGMKIVHTDEGIDKVAMAAHHHDEHGENREEDHHLQEKSLDPHIWLSPRLVQKQAAVIHAALVALLPEQVELFDRNYARFVGEIEALDCSLRSLLAPYRGRPFMVFHPTWGYFAHDYGLEQIAIEIEGKNPKPAQLKELIEHARGEGIRAVFTQQQFSQKSAALIAREIGGRVISIDPLAENWPASLKTVAEELAAAFDEKHP